MWVDEKSKLTIEFLKSKIEEYERLQREIKILKQEVDLLE